MGSAVKNCFWVFLAAGLAAAFFFHSQHYAFITDDAYISFRYAKNFAEGNGLVYNVGERVEGYTNFLWVVLVAALIKSNLDPEIYATIISRGVSFILLGYIFWLSWRRHGRVDFACFIAIGLLVCNRTFVAWSTGGLATAPFTALAFIAVCEYSRKDRPTIREGLLFSLVALTRPEGLIFFGVAFVHSLLRVTMEPKDWKRHLMWSVGFFAVFGPYFAWRLSYYGYLLPNTFYAKVPETGGYFSKGIPYVLNFFEVYFVYALVLPVLYSLTSGERSDRRHTSMLFSVLVTYLA